MQIDISKLPPGIKLELTKADLEAFALTVVSNLQPTAELEKEKKDEILWIDDAVKFLNLAKPTIYGMTSKGTIQFYRRGRKIYFLKSDLEAWLMAGKQKTLSEMECDMENYLSNNFNSENR